MEVSYGLRRQDERAIARLGDGEGLLRRTGRRDGVMRTGRDALTTPDAVLFDDLHHARLGRQRDGISRANAYTRQACDASGRIDGEAQYGLRVMVSGIGVLASWRTN